jgi:hypothetical protein
MSQASDEELLAQQPALQEEAWEVLGKLDVAALVADIGQLLFAGSGRWGPAHGDQGLPIPGRVGVSVA